MPLLFSRPRRRVLFEIHEPCPGTFRYIGLRISVDESSELAETLRLVARPREIKVYEPVGSDYVGARSFPVQTLNRAIKLLCPLTPPCFRVNLRVPLRSPDVVPPTVGDLFPRIALDYLRY